eukprot:442745_1
MFLESIGLAKYCQNFADRGINKMDDVRDVDHDYLNDEIQIKNYGDQRKIIKGIKLFAQRRKRGARLDALDHFEIGNEAYTLGEKFWYWKPMKDHVNYIEP